MTERAEGPGTALAGQVEIEGAAVAEMYRLLDGRLEDTRLRLAATIARRAEHPSELFERDVEAARLRDEIRRLQRGEQGLCFGRLDLQDGTVVRIGKLHLRDPGREEIVLTDWRADAAGPFYTATADAPAGVRRRRHLRLAGREVVGVIDEILDGSEATEADATGRDPLIEVLEAARTGRMPHVVATLKAEQDAMIRSGQRGVTVVQGGPGTGKTVVALHRAAYVLYSFPELAQRGVLVCGPSRQFLDYISHVLPSLGEDAVELATVATLSGISSGIPSGRIEPVDVARVKGRAEFAIALRDWVEARQARVDALSFGVDSETIGLDGSMVSELRRSSLQAVPWHNGGRAVFASLLLDHVVEELGARFSAREHRMDAELEQSLGVDFDAAAAADLRSLGLEPDADSLGGDVAFDAEYTRAHLAAHRTLEPVVESVWPALDPVDVVRAVLADPRSALEGLLDLEPEVAAALQGRDARSWSDADLALLDEAGALVDGPPDRVFGHLVVDEAQDLTRMQWRMLMRRCPSRSMTVVGDLAQAAATTTVRSWSDALDGFLSGPFDLHTLTVNYRTTRPILEHSRALLAMIDPAQPPAVSLRDGDDPVVLTVAADDFADLASARIRMTVDAHPDATIALLCSEALLPRLDPLTGRVRVLTAHQAKGLEFDSVMVIDPDGITQEPGGGLRGLYVALTRATNRLTVIHLES